jgi:hypothetical protein
VDNISNYIANLSPNDELIQEFNKDYELPKEVSSWEDMRVMLDKVVPLNPQNTHSNSKNPSMAYLPTEGDGFHTADVRESAVSYSPDKIPRSAHCRIYNLSSKRKPKI